MTQESLPSETQVPTLIEVWAPSCSSCRAIEKDLLEVAEAHREEVVLHRLDASSDLVRARELGVLGTPSFVGVRDGHEVFRRTGRLSRSDIEDMFEALANDGRVEPRRLGTESLLALAAGAVLVVAGMATGPSLPLAIIGGALMASGAGFWLRGRRGD